MKVSVEENKLPIKGEGEKEGEDEETGRRYSSRIDVPPKLYIIEGIKAEMKNGMLMVVILALRMFMMIVWFWFCRV